MWCISLQLPSAHLAKRSVEAGGEFDLTSRRQKTGRGMRWRYSSFYYVLQRGCHSSCSRWLGSFMLSPLLEHEDKKKGDLQAIIRLEEESKFRISHCLFLSFLVLVFKKKRLVRVVVQNQTHIVAWDMYLRHAVILKYFVSDFWEL